MQDAVDRGKMQCTERKPKMKRMEKEKQHKKRQDQRVERIQGDSGWCGVV
jgi:hypothetical protein